MKKLCLWAAFLPFLMLMTGCASYRLERVDLLYLGQSYLPLPDLYTPEPDIRKLVQDAPASSRELGCALPLARWRDANGGGRPTAQLLTGMTLRQVETTYERNRSFALPAILESEWTVPKPEPCGGDASWNRASLLQVRHLLSRAIGEAPVMDVPPDTDYFLQALRWAGCSAEKKCSFTGVRRKFLEPFVNNLQVTYRDTGLTWEGMPENHPRQVPPAVIQTNLSDYRTLAGWFQAVSEVRDADFFMGLTDLVDAGGEKLDFGTLCARLQWRKPATSQFQKDPPQSGSKRGFDARSEVERSCNFNLKRLSVPVGTWDFGITKDWANKLSNGQLTLLQTGDALLMFRPAAHAEVLDSSARAVCPPGKPTLDCNETQRLSQGFTDFELLFDVFTAPQGAAVKVPITMSVRQFERQLGNGGKISRIKRSLNWVPSMLLASNLAEQKKGSEVVRASAFSEGGYIELRFLPYGSEEWRRSSSLYIDENLKSQVLLAPGDVLTIER